MQLSDEKELADKIKSSIDENKNTYIDVFLKNPLLLSLYILTFQSNASIPNKKYLFYRRVINALFSEHDSKTKLGFVRQKRTGLNQEQFDEILKAFCYLSYFENRFAFDYDYVDSKMKEIKSKLHSYTFNTVDILYDFKSALAIWIEDNGEYSFAHRSLQEYYAALFVKNINENNKDRLYKKIANVISNNLSVSEIENFLSLCQEMDTLCFNEYYLLPLIYELRDIIAHDNDKNIFESIIKFLYAEIVIPKHFNEHQMGLRSVINVEVYRTIYIQYKYTSKINQIIRQNIMTNYKSFTKFIGKSLSVNDMLSDKYLQVISTQNVLNISLALSKHLDTYAAEISQSISDSKNNDQEFIDMI